MRMISWPQMIRSLSLSDLLSTNLLKKNNSQLIQLTNSWKRLLLSKVTSKVLKVFSDHLLIPRNQQHIRDTQIHSPMLRLKTQKDQSICFNSQEDNHSELLIMLSYSKFKRQIITGNKLKEVNRLLRRNSLLHLI